MSEAIEAILTIPGCKWCGATYLPDPGGQAQRRYLCNSSKVFQAYQCKLNVLDTRVAELKELEQQPAVSDEMRREIKRLRAKLSHRKCWDCGHVDYYTSDVLPYCRCANCQSRDTRLVHKSYPNPGANDDQQKPTRTNQ